jgi:hypothetical protein
MGKNKNKAPEAKPGDKPCSSKRKVYQQSAPLTFAVSLPEKAKNPKAVAAEVTPLSPPPNLADVAKGTSSATNVVEDDRKIAVLPEYAAKPRVAITGAASVVAGEEVL